MKTIELQSPLDMHLHLREGCLLETVAPLSADFFAGAVVMPNLKNPIDSLEKLLNYKKEILRHTQGKIFEPYMTLFFKRFTKKELQEAKKHIIGIKLYPENITTNTELGVACIKAEEETFNLLERLNIPLMVHGESDGEPLERESEFLETYEWLARSFPNLKIIMEHITTAKALILLDRYPNLYATITPHHLLLSTEDVIGNTLNSHHFCKPIAKSKIDRAALQATILQGHPKISLGTDSAPHQKDAKESSKAPAGIFTAPIALPLLAELFEKNDSLENLQAFVSDNARNIYNITPKEKIVSLKATKMQIPESYGNIVPLFASKQISWSFSE